VSIGNIGKKLRREATANPKKAVFLGIGTAVAVYFWIPLVWGWIGKSDTNVAPSTVNPVSTVAIPVVAQTVEPVAKAVVTNRPSWPQLIEAMHNDPRTMTAPPLTNNRNPFESTTVTLVKPQIVEQPKPKAAVITPSAAGLALTSTIIGPHRRIAQINGKTYSVGQTIEVASSKETPDVSFKLIEVQPRRAVLEANGERFELLIPEPGKSNKIELLGAMHN
jgi:hypothetical protein